MIGVGHESVEGLVVKGGELAKYLWPLQHSLPAPVIPT